MRFAAALLFGLVAADKSYFLKRQDNPIAGVFATLKPMVEQLDQAVLAYTGGPGTEIINQSKKIAATVKQSVATVSGLAPLDISAAAALPGPVQDFTATLKKTIDDLVSKKALSVQNGLGATVYNNLEEQLSGATALANAIKSKMPDSLQAVATQLSGDILTVLNGGISSFKDVATAGPAAGAGAGAGAGAAGSSPASGSTTSTSGSAGGAGASLSPAGSSTTVSGSGAGAGMSSSSGMSGGMSSMGGSASGSASYGASGSYDASSPQTTSARGSSPAVFTGAGASFKPASVFGLVAVAAAVFVL